MRVKVAITAITLLLAGGCGGEEELSFASASAVMNELAEAGFDSCADGKVPDDYQAQCGEGADALYITHYVEPDKISLYVQELESVPTGAAVARGENWTVVVYNATTGEEVAEALGGTSECFEGTNVKC